MPRIHGPPRPRTRRSVVAALVTALVATGFAIAATGATTAGAAPRVFGSGSTFLPGVNAGNSPQLASGPDGTNLAVFVDRDDFQYVASTRRITFSIGDAPLPLAKASGVLGPLYDIAITDDLTQVAASATGTAQDTLNKNPASGRHRHWSLVHDEEAVIDAVGTKSPGADRLDAVEPSVGAERSLEQGETRSRSPRPKATHRPGAVRGHYGAAVFDRCS